MLEYQNIKAFLQIATLQIGLKKLLRLKMLKILCHGKRLEIIGTFFKKELQKTN